MGDYELVLHLQGLWAYVLCKIAIRGISPFSCESPISRLDSFTNTVVSLIADLGLKAWEVYQVTL